MPYWGGCGLSGESTSLRVVFEASKAHGSSKFSLFLSRLPMDEVVKLSVRRPCLLCASILHITMIMD